MATCIICNKEFEAKRSDAKICSPKCRQQAARSGIKLRGSEKTNDVQGNTQPISKVTKEAYDAPKMDQAVNDEPPKYIAGIDPFRGSDDESVGSVTV